jgi:adenine phosphoribosyltransferase
MTEFNNILSEAIRNAPIVEHEGKFDIYPEFGSLMIDPGLVSAIADRIMAIANLNCEKIALIESMAIPVGTVLALKSNIPYTVIRKREYKLPGEVSVKEIAGYDRADFYINGVTKGQKILLFDDTINTGETLGAVVRTFRHIGAELVDIITIMDKGSGRKDLEKELGLEIKTLVNVKITGDGVTLSFEVD